MIPIFSVGDDTLAMCFIPSDGVVYYLVTPEAPREQGELRRFTLESAEGRVDADFEDDARAHEDGRYVWRMTANMNVEGFDIH